MLFDMAFRKTLRTGHRTFELDIQLRTDQNRLVILGPSGAGKSQTLRAIAGLLRPDSGYIRLADQVLFDHAKRQHLSPQARQMGYLFQEYALFPHLTVRQNIAFGRTRRWLNPSRQRADSQVDYWIDAFQLRAVAHQYPDALSGGQKQRTALARTLITHPRLLLLDEPFAALDPPLRRTMRQELDQLQRRLSIPMLLITHDPEDARLFGDQVLHLQDGKLALE